MIVASGRRHCRTTHPAQPSGRRRLHRIRVDVLSDSSRGKCLAPSRTEPAANRVSPPRARCIGAMRSWFVGHHVSGRHRSRSLPLLVCHRRCSESQDRRLGRPRKVNATTTLKLAGLETHRFRLAASPVREALPIASLFRPAATSAIEWASRGHLEPSRIPGPLIGDCLLAQGQD